MSKPLTVFGATGQQGGNLVDYTLSNPELSRAYKIRVIYLGSIQAYCCGAPGEGRGGGQGNLIH